MEAPTMHKYPERGLLAIEYLPVIPTPSSKTGTYGNGVPWGCQLAIEFHNSTATDLLKSPMTITACGHGGDVRDEDQTVVLIDADPPIMGGRIVRKKMQAKPPSKNKCQTPNFEILPGWLSWWKMATKSEKNVKTPNNVSKKVQNSYITHLYGWTAWWFNATKMDGRNEETSTTRMKRSEVEKAKFVSKFYPELSKIDSKNPIETQNRPEKRYGAKKPEKTTTSKLIGSCTPKRGREFDNFSDFESPHKRSKNNFFRTLRFWEPTISRVGCDEVENLPGGTETLDLIQGGTRHSVR